jgi:hypothetical protein
MGGNLLTAAPCEKGKRVYGEKHGQQGAIGYASAKSACSMLASESDVRSTAFFVMNPRLDHVAPSINVMAPFGEHSAGQESAKKLLRDTCSTGVIVSHMQIPLPNTSILQGSRRRMPLPDRPWAG